MSSPPDFTSTIDRAYELWQQAKRRYDLPAEIVAALVISDALAGIEDRISELINTLDKRLP